MRVWLETAHQAGKLALSNDYHDIKQMLEKIGTNRKVKDKEVGVEFPNPFDILLKFKALQGDELHGGQAIKKGQKVKTAQCPVLSGFLNEVRTITSSVQFCLFFVKYPDEFTETTEYASEATEIIYRLP
jgi:hypothetical protein